MFHVECRANFWKPFEWFSKFRYLKLHIVLRYDFNFQLSSILYWLSFQQLKEDKNVMDTISHVLQPSDTLSSLSIKYNCKVSECCMCWVSVVVGRSCAPIWYWFMAYWFNSCRANNEMGLFVVVVLRCTDFYVMAKPRAGV